MAQPFGGGYSQNLNSGLSTSSNMQRPNLVQKIKNKFNNLMSSSNTQTAQSQLNSHSNSISSSNVHNSNFAQSSGSQFTNLMAKTDASASTGSFAALNAHGVQSQSVSHSKSFSGKKLQNTDYQLNVGSQFTNLMTNTHTNTAAGSFASSSTHGARSQLASHSNIFSESTLNQGHMATGSQFANVMSTAATEVRGGRMKFLQYTLLYLSVI